MAKGLCFVAGTIIKTAQGEKSIEDIQVGDSVWSYNEDSAKCELNIVEGISVTENVTKLVKLIIDNEVIYSTLDHPFYVNGNWIKAKNLTVGNELKLFDYSTVRLKAIFNIDTLVTVYNFGVLNNNNYFVSGLSILVHNNSCAHDAGTSKAGGFVALEEGAQSAKGIDLYVDDIVKAQKSGGVWPHEPIQIVWVDGKKVILDGHHRIKAAEKAGYTGDIPYTAIDVEDSGYTLEQLREWTE